LRRGEQEKHERGDEARLSLQAVPTVSFNAQLNGYASQVSLSAGAPGSNDFRNCRP